MPVMFEVEPANTFKVPGELKIRPVCGEVIRPPEILALLEETLTPQALPVIDPPEIDRLPELSNLSPVVKLVTIEPPDIVALPV